MAAGGVSGSWWSDRRSTAPISARCSRSRSWCKALTAQADVTILSSQPPGRELPIADQYPLAAAVETWPEPAFLRRRFERLEAMAKPSVPLFFAWARRWIAGRLAAGERFDIAHQVLPQAMRYASPLRHFAMPYVVGPLGGGLSTPAPFLEEVGRAPLMTRARAIDGWRLRHDPWLRAGYARAGLVLGVAPYVAEALAPVPVRRFEVLLERSHQGDAPHVERQGEAGRLELLHVGRVVRTKGLRDMVRAMAHLADLPGGHPDQRRRRRGSRRLPGRGGAARARPPDRLSRPGAAGRGRRASTPAPTSSPSRASASRWAASSSRRCTGGCR